MKKLMLLGGIRYLIPVIKRAQEMGLYVITCDYLPDNEAHAYSDEYCNVSIIDKEAVLECAERLKIDGIMSFACDPGVTTAAYVAERMGLPFQGSYESVKILQDKGLFRKFLADHHFHVPHAKSYTDIKKPFEDRDYFTWPVIVKPVDSAGSKGVSRADSPDELEAAVQRAVECSPSGTFIIEDFLTFEGYHSSADAFTIDGELKFITYSDQLFDTEADNPYTPSLIIWPSTMKSQYQEILTRETQRLVKLLGMNTGIYNIETCVGVDGRPYIMEVSPRGGGCKIAEIQQMAYGVDLIGNEIKKAVGLPLEEMKPIQCNGVWCEMIVHAHAGQSGKLAGISMDPEIEKKYLKLLAIQTKAGDEVKPFTGANRALGDIFFRFESREELDDIMSRPAQWLNIELMN